MWRGKVSVENILIGKAPVELPMRRYLNSYIKKYIVM
jgi:hypothetical protein